ncbi:hypothetical protein Btru_040395 [Bulinus truncatus]|nr:hypothetical protein Btru_040395 [Bulinus truncatus]
MPGSSEVIMAQQITGSTISVTCQDPKRNHEVMAYLNEMRKSGVGCDFKIIIRDQVFHTHKVVLGSACHYFRALFDFGGKDSDSIKLHDLDPDVIILILDFFYTGEIRLTPDKVNTVIIYANYMGIVFLRKECQAFMKALLDEDNVLPTLKFATDYSLEYLRESCVRYIQKHLNSRYLKEDLFNMEPSTLKDILDNDDLPIGFRFVEGEEFVLETILMYLSRKKVTDELINMLMPVVRFPLISLEALTITMESFPNLQKNELIKNYASLGNQVRMMDKRKLHLEENSAIPKKWTVPRNLVCLEFCSVDHRFVTTYLHKRPVKPRGYSAVSLQKEIASVCIWIRPIEIFSAVIGGLKVRYRSLFQSPASENKTLGDGVNDNVQYNPDWIQKKFRLRVGEQITGIRVDSDACFVYGIEFYTNTERLLGYRSDRSGFGVERIAPDEPSAHLGAICWDEEEYLDEPVVVNLVMRWFHSPL